MLREANQSELIEMIIKNIAITKLMVMSKSGASTSHIVNPVTAPTRCVTLSIDLAFCTYPARRPMTAQERMMTK
jgi:hypothetical protein